jgi:hypothetical protein
MNLSRRGRVVTAWITAAVLVIGGVAAVLFIGGRAGVGPLADIIGPGRDGEPRAPRVIPAAPPTCPLTGVDPEGEVPARPALAIKVENLPAARPQTGLSWADIVYEEPVEGGITRFIAVYQCQDAQRVQPVRSARLTDVDILVQFGKPLFAYSGAAGKVDQALAKAGFIDVNAIAEADAYELDPARSAPHNLYTDTRDLYRAARGKIRRQGLGAPSPVFLYTSSGVKGKKVSELHVPFSSWASDVYWRWSADSESFLRSHGTEPHVSSDGTQYSAKNVVVQVVETVLTDVADANGVPSPKVISVGEGKAYVLRNGRITVGRWERPTSEDLTRFYDRKGNEVRLIRGNTWVELVPQDVSVTYS